MSLNKLFEELSTAALAAYDAEMRFRALAAVADRNDFRCLPENPSSLFDTPRMPIFRGVPRSLIASRLGSDSAIHAMMLAIECAAGVPSKRQ
jgi:hypothetical protein